MIPKAIAFFHFVMIIRHWDCWQM